MYLEYEKLANKIIGCAIKVHRILGPGFLESIYENALVIELKAIKNIENIHFSIVRSYLRALNLSHGLILNFNKVKIEVKRVIAAT